MWTFIRNWKKGALERMWLRPEDAEERLKKKVEEALKEGKRFPLGVLYECSPQTDSNTQRLWSSS